VCFFYLRNFRFQNDIEVQHFRANPLENLGRKHGKGHDPRRCRLGFRGGCLEKACRNPTLKDRVLSRAFSEELESLMHAGGRLFFDPRGHLIHLWNKIFLSACLLSLFVDPLFLYLTGTQRNMCIEFKYPLALTLSMIRSLLDLFYAAHILFRFRTAFIAPSSRVFGRGELVIQPYKIARRYLGRTFWFDLVTALPLPQFVIWIVIPRLNESPMANRKNILRFSILSQYLPRLFQIFPLSRQIVMATGVMTETAWAGAAYNLILYMLASHVRRSSIASPSSSGVTISSFPPRPKLLSFHHDEILCAGAGSAVVSLLGAAAGVVLEGGVPAGGSGVPDHVLRLQDGERQQDCLVRAEQHHEPVRDQQRVLPVRDLRGGAGRQALVLVLHPEILLLLLVGAQEPQVRNQGTDRCVFGWCLDRFIAKIQSLRSDFNLR
jgi:hypothetical protein